MKLLFDIDDIVIPITQSIYVNFLNKIIESKEIYNCMFSFSENGSGVADDVKAHAELTWLKVLERVNPISMFEQLVNQFDWDCLFRAPESEISRNKEDKYARNLIDTFESCGISLPNKIIRIPFISDYNRERFIQEAFDENYVLITSSVYLSQIAHDCEHILYIILLTRPHNVEFSLNIINQKDSKYILSGDILSAFQTFASITSCFNKQDMLKQVDGTLGAEQSDGKSDNK
jgi:hypothetical protein